MKRAESNKIWIMNFEEAYGRQSESKLLKDFCRHLFCVEAGDIYVSSVRIPKDFMKYVSSLKGISNKRKWIIELEKNEDSYYLCDSIAADNSAVKAIKRLRPEKFRLRPFYESEKVNSLSSFLDIPVNGMNKKIVEGGLVKKYNDKLYFKRMSLDLGIDTIPGYFTKNRKNQVVKAINNICEKPSDKAFLKKNRLNGKNSNLKGERDFIFKNLEAWLLDYNGDIMIEEFLDFIEICGSLVRINDSGCVFLGINSQIINDCIWQGCSLSVNNDSFSEEIKKKSMKYAERLHASKGRGMLNIDWGIARLKNNGLKLYALESNFRYNGFEYVLDIFQSCFKGELQNKYIVYYNSFPISEEIKNFTDLIKKTQNIYIDNSPVILIDCKSEQGAVFTTCPIQNKIGFIIVGNSPLYLKMAKEAIQKAVV